MNNVVVNARIAAPPRQVFNAIANPHKPFLTNNPFTHLEVIGEQTSGADTIYRGIFTLPLGLRFQFYEVVTKWVENELFCYRAISCWSMAATNQLTPENGQTRITFSLRYRLTGLWKWLIPRWLVRLIQKSFANLKRSFEQPGGAG